MNINLLFSFYGGYTGWPKNKNSDIAAKVPLKESKAVI